MSGPDAVAYLQSMVSNDVEAIAPGGGTYALLLTPKARVIADLEVFRTGADLVLACPPETRDDVVGRSSGPGSARRSSSSRPAARSCGARPTARWPSSRRRSGVSGSVAAAPGRRTAPADWEVARIEAGMPRFGREFDRRRRCPPRPASRIARSASPRAAIPARSRSRGCTTAATPTAACAACASPGDAAAPGTPVIAEGREVGRVTSVADSPRFGRSALRSCAARSPTGRGRCRRRRAHGRPPAAVRLDATSPSRRSRRPCRASRRRR